MIDSWQGIITFIVSVIGMLTTIYKIGFKDEQNRTQAYYKETLLPFIVAYQKNSNMNTIKFLKDAVKRDNDNVPKYVFYLLDNQERDKLRKVLLYDYFDLYHNDDNTMRRIMKWISRFLVYLLFGASLFITFYGSFFLVSGVLSILMDLVHGFDGTINGVDTWKWSLKNIFLGLVSIFLSIVYISLVKKINDDRYTFKKKKIERLINKKVKLYDKYSEKNVI